MESGSGKTVGLGVIEASVLKESVKKEYARRWRRWSSWCEENGVDPLAATGGDALRWIGAAEGSLFRLEVRQAVNFVYQSLGMASPLREWRVMRALFGGNGRYAKDEDLDPTVRPKMRRRVRDYVSWCERNGRAALPGSAEQSAEFLRFLSDWNSYRLVSTADYAVSRYLEANGYPGTSHHPDVLAALPDCRARIEARGGKRNRVASEESTERANRALRQWRDWCEAEGIDWHQASPADGLRYLRGLEHQRSAGTRAGGLSKLCAGEANPFSSEVVLEWRKWHAKAVEEGTLPKVRSATRADEVVGRMRAVRAAEIEVVPEGLTREELEAVQGDVRNRVVKSTLRGYARSWARFESWLIGRKTALAKVTGWHVAVYLKSLAEGRRFGTIQNVRNGLAMVFDELGFVDNPALSVEVERYLKKLELQRREAPAQVEGFREQCYQAVVESLGKALKGEMGLRKELSAATDIFMIGMMFDGLLRSVEMAAVRRQDVSRFSDGSGRLLVPYSKTDPLGNGEVTYVSGRTMEYRDRMNGLRRMRGLVVTGDDRILQFKEETIRRRFLKACADAGLEGRWGSHSMRVGMAQELAVAGFGLVLIMRAGRWESPKMPALYIRELKVDETAVAVLHRLWAEGRARVDANSRGYDVLSTYSAVRYAM